MTSQHLAQLNLSLDTASTENSPSLTTGLYSNETSSHWISNITFWVFRRRSLIEIKTPNGNFKFLVGWDEFWSTYYSNPMNVFCEISSLAVHMCGKCAPPKSIIQTAVPPGECLWNNECLLPPPHVFLRHPFPFSHTPNQPHPRPTFHHICSIFIPYPVFASIWWTDFSNIIVWGYFRIYFQIIIMHIVEFCPENSFIIIL